MTTGEVKVLKLHVKHMGSKIRFLRQRCDHLYEDFNALLHTKDELESQLQRKLLECELLHAKLIKAGLE